MILSSYGQFTCENFFGSNTVKKNLKKKNQYHLIILSHFNAECFLTIAKTFHVPVVRTLSCSLLPWSSHKFGNPINPAYMPNIFTDFSYRMSVFERTENALINLFHIYYNYLVGMNNDTKVAMKYFGELGSTLSTDILNDSLLLVNAHFSLNFPVPRVPNIIEVGGIHLKATKILPKVGD